MPTLGLVVKMTSAASSTAPGGALHDASNYSIACSVVTQTWASVSFGREKGGVLSRSAADLLSQETWSP